MLPLHEEKSLIFDIKYALHIFCCFFPGSGFTFYQEKYLTHTMVYLNIQPRK